MVKKCVKVPHDEAAIVKPSTGVPARFSSQPGHCKVCWVGSPDKTMGSPSAG